MNSAAIHRIDSFVGIVDGDKGSEMCPGSSRDSIGAVHSDLVTPMLELFDDLSGVVPKFVGAAAAPVLIPGRGEVHVDDVECPERDVHLRGGLEPLAIRRCG